MSRTVKWTARRRRRGRAENPELMSAFAARALAALNALVRIRRYPPTRRCPNSVVPAWPAGRGMSPGNSRGPGQVSARFAPGDVPSTNPMQSTARRATAGGVLGGHLPLCGRCRTGLRPGDAALLPSRADATSPLRGPSAVLTGRRATSSSGPNSIRASARRVRRHHRSRPEDRSGVRRPGPALEPRLVHPHAENSRVGHRDTPFIGSIEQGQLSGRLIFRRKTCHGCMTDNQRGLVVPDALGDLDQVGDWCRRPAHRFI